MRRVVMNFFLDEDVNTMNLTRERNDRDESNARYSNAKFIQYLHINKIGITISITTPIE